MLEDCLVESRPSARRKNPVTVAVSIITHGVVAGALILIPLFQEQLLPQVQFTNPLQPPAVRAVELLPQSSRPVAAASTAPDARRSNEFVAPPVIPRTIDYVVDPADSPTVVGIPPGTGGGSLSGFPTSDSTFGLPPRGNPPPPPPPVATPPPPPPAPPVTVQAPAVQAPVRRGGEVVRSNLIYQVTPVYPFLAKQARVEGVVTLEAIITRQGAIQSLRVLSGHILLNEAALEAVKQWRYRPTLLNGEPVEVITNIVVTFRLN